MKRIYRHNNRDKRGGARRKKEFVLYGDVARDNASNASHLKKMKGRMPITVPELMDLAAAGSKDACFLLAVYMLCGHGVKRNVAEGIKLLGIAASKGSVEAVNLLADLECEGRITCGVDKNGSLVSAGGRHLRDDDGAALAWAEAMVGLAFCDGEILPKSDEAVVKWFEAAASHDEVCGKACNFFWNCHKAKENYFSAMDCVVKWPIMRDRLDDLLAVRERAEYLYDLLRLQVESFLDAILLDERFEIEEEAFAELCGELCDVLNEFKRIFAECGIVEDGE